MMPPAPALADHHIGAEAARWAIATALAAVAHVGLVAAYLSIPESPPRDAARAPAIIVDLAPMPVAPPSQADLAPGPETADAVPPPPDSPPIVDQEVVERPFAEPVPPAETPAEATLPPPAPKLAEKKIVEAKPAESAPGERKPIETPKLKKPDPKPVERHPPAPATVAHPRSEHPPAPVARAPSPGSAASRAAIASWRDRVVAQLQRAKRYPSGARDRQGVATVSFSVNRDGRVLGRRLVRSSGHAALDQEALAMVARAQPLPPFPPAMTQPQVQLSMPVRFALR